MKNIILTIILAGFFVSKAAAQSDSTLLADETVMLITKSNKTLIICNNETVAIKIIKAYLPAKDIRYTFAFKKDRHGSYPEYRITLPIDAYDNLKKNFR